jgi:hypothetical protein
MGIFWVLILIVFSHVNGEEEDYDLIEEGPECVVHHPPHNDEFSCGSLCDPSLLKAEIVRAVYLTGFRANFDCLKNKSSIIVSIPFSFFIIIEF